MNTCPYCGVQVYIKKKGSTGQDVGVCPKHGEILLVLLVKR